jgi:hypothetical protein
VVSKSATGAVSVPPAESDPYAEIFPIATTAFPGDAGVWPVRARAATATPMVATTMSAAVRNQIRRIGDVGRGDVAGGDAGVGETSPEGARAGSAPSIGAGSGARESAMVVAGGPAIRIGAVVSTIAGVSIAFCRRRSANASTSLSGGRSSSCSTRSS